MKISTKINAALTLFLDAVKGVEYYIYFIAYCIGVIFITSSQPTKNDTVKAGFIFVGFPIVCNIIRAICKLKTYDEVVSDYENSTFGTSYETDNSDESDDSPLINVDELAKPLVDLD